MSMVVSEFYKGTWIWSTLTATVPNNPYRAAVDQTVDPHFCNQPLLSMLGNNTVIATIDLPRTQSGLTSDSSLYSSLETVVPWSKALNSHLCDNNAQLSLCRHSIHHGQVPLGSTSRHCAPWSLIPDFNNWVTMVTWAELLWSPCTTPYPYHALATSPPGFPPYY
jgi:hypothetical protein